MLYQRPKFTLPTAGGKVSQRQWDFSTMSKEQFTEKYGSDSYPSDLPEQE